jgi:hypothetical protein
MPVMRHLLLPAPEDVVRIWQTDRKLATATARPHQAICELDPTLLSPMVEPTKRSQNRGMAPPLPDRIGPVEFGGWVISLLSNALKRCGAGSQRWLVDRRRWPSDSAVQSSD